MSCAGHENEASQWEFYLLPKAVLDAQLPKQKELFYLLFSRSHPRGARLAS
jgi:hypothetical protein